MTYRLNTIVVDDVLMVSPLSFHIGFIKRSEVVSRDNTQVDVGLLISTKDNLGNVEVENVCVLIKSLKTPAAIALRTNNLTSSSYNRQ